MIYGVDESFKEEEIVFIEAVMAQVIKHLSLPETYLDVFFTYSDS